MQYLNNILDYFDLAKNYRRYQLKLIKKHIADNILEVGPGKGEIIKNFIDDHKAITLLDSDKEICKILKERFKDKNLNIINADISLVNKKFNTILYMDVIEHIKNDTNELDNAIDRLELNGKIIIVVPAFNFLFSEFDKNVGHYKRYSKKHFYNYKNEHVKLIDIKYFDSIGFFILSISKFFKFKDNKKTALGIKVWDFLIPFSRFIDKLILHSFGKSLICVYQKKSNLN